MGLITYVEVKYMANIVSNKGQKGKLKVQCSNELFEGRLVEIKYLYYKLQNKYLKYFRTNKSIEEKKWNLKNY